MGRSRSILESTGRWPTVIVWAFAIIALSSMPNYFPPSSPGELNFDKLVHFLEYLILGGLVVASAMRSNFAVSTWVVVSAAIAGVAAFGVVDEMYQRLVPGRDTNVYDWMADVLGATAGALAAAYVLSYSSRCSGR